MATACKHAPKADEAITTKAQSVAKLSLTGTEYKVDIQKSSIAWIGTKPVGQHHGTFLINEGSIVTEDNAIQGGHFVINIAGLTAYDDDGSANNKLQKHLKSADFFDVAHYTIATFDITSVTEYLNLDKKTVMKDASHMVTGNLKIKDIAKNITFPAKITIAEGRVVSDAVFNMNRTLWGITYDNDKSLGDKFINPEVNITLHIEAVK